LYYLAGYAFTLAAAFVVICLVARESDDIAVLAGLNRRSPLLALSLTLAMVSLAGVPPLAGFLGKLLLLKAVLQQAATNGAYLWLALVAVAGVVISLFYYFGVIRAVYWPRDTPDLTPIPVSWPMKCSLGLCIAGMLYLGIFPDPVLNAATQAVRALKF
jgi:NADH-quinone oxidoreductase subunit N